MTRVLLLTIVWISAAPFCHADIVQTNGPASLTIQHPGNTPTIALADTITVTLTVDGSTTLRVQAPLELPRSAKWQLVERSKADRDSIGPERVRWRLVYRFAPREPGEVSFAFPEVKFRDRDDQDQSATWEPITFTVKTQITKLDRAAIRGVADIESLPAAAPDIAMWPVWTALAAVAELLAAGWFGWRRWFRRRELKTPAAWALSELDRLVALELPKHGRSERFITLLTLLLRRYLDKQFQLPARRQTTPEFLRDLDAQSEFTAEEKRFLTTFLSRCDAVKFAGTEMPTDECNQWANATRIFLQSDKKLNEEGRKAGRIQI
jgi:hypothetical protein